LSQNIAPTSAPNGARKIQPAPSTGSSLGIWLRSTLPKPWRAASRSHWMKSAA
jgi:hypothetical protein